MEKMKTRLFITMAAAAMLLGAASATSLLWPGTAHAQEETAKDKANLAQAEEHYKAAEVLYRLSKFKDALEQYTAAYKLIRSANLLFNMAQCYRMLGQMDDALFHFKSFRDDYRREHGDQLPPNIEEVERLILQLKAKKVLDKEKGRLAEQVKKEQARRKEQLAREEKLRKEQLSREDKHRTDLKEIIKLQQNQTKKKPPKGQLVISLLDVDGAQVIVDSVPRAVAPVIKPIPLKPGKYRLQVKANGYLDHVVAIEIKDKEQTSVAVTLRPLPKKSRFWLASTISCLALALGAEAMAVAFTFKADEHYRNTPPYDQDVTLMYVGHGMAGAFGAAAITSLVLYLRSDRVEEPPPVSVGFSPLPGGGAVSGGFRF